MTIQEFHTRMASTDATPEALQADLAALIQTEIDAAIKKNYDTIDKTLKAFGLERGEGVKTLDALHNGLAKLKSDAAEAKKNAPPASEKVAELEQKLRTEYEAKLDAQAKKLASLERDTLSSSILSQVNVNVPDELKKQAELVRKHALAELMGEYEIDPQTLYLKKSDGTFLTDGTNILTAPQKISQYLEPFATKTTPAGAKPTPPTGGKSAPMNYAEMAQYALDNNIDLYTQAGQVEIRRIIATDGK